MDAHFTERSPEESSVTRSMREVSIPRALAQAMKASAVVSGIARVGVCVEGPLSEFT